MISVRQAPHVDGIVLAKLPPGGSTRLEFNGALSPTPTMGESGTLPVISLTDVSSIMHVTRLMTAENCFNRFVYDRFVR